MDSKYIITPSGNFVSTDELYHWGIKGMKWGIRRYQNADGTLTDQGKKRYLNPDGTLNKKGKKKFGDSVKLPEKTNQKTLDELFREHVSTLTDQELQQNVNRLRNEYAYKSMAQQLGYNTPTTDMDRKIAELKQQKEYLQLQKDIRDLTPDKTSAGKKFMKSVMSKVVAPVATDLAKNYLSQYLGDAAAKILAKEAKDTADKVKNSAEKVKEKEAKKEAKAATKEEKSRVYRDDDNSNTSRNSGSRSSNSSGSQVHYAEVVGGSSSSSRRSSSSGSNRSPIIDAEVVNRSVTSLTTTSSSYNNSWSSRYSNTPVRNLPSSNVYGYLPAPKDDDD